MKPIDKIISFFREEGMMTANPAGGSGGFSGSADSKGPRAGFDPVMKKTTRRKNTIGLWANSLKKKKK
tara:strand:- start:110 stop:313 length:204 start_codon:yes stop_codon:yes gene_type:complete